MDTKPDSSKYWQELISWKFWLHTIIVDIILAGIWFAINKLITIQPITRDIGFLLLLIAGLFAVAWYLPKFSIKRQSGRKVERAKIKELDSDLLKWLQGIISNQSQNIPLSIRGKIDHLDFTNIETTEPYIKIVIELTNMSVFTFNGITFEGSIKIDNNECSLRPEVLDRRILPFPSEKASITIKQPISSQTAGKLRLIGQEKQLVKIDMNNLWLHFQIENEGFEGEAILKLKELDVIPKGIAVSQWLSEDSLKDLIYKGVTNIEIRKASVKKIEKQGYFLIEIETFIRVSQKMVPLSKLRLHIANEVMEPIIVIPQIPRLIKTEAELYTATYEVTYQQMLKGRVKTEGEPKYQAHISAIIGDQEPKSEEFKFDFPQESKWESHIVWKLK